MSNYNPQIQKVWATESITCYFTKIQNPHRFGFGFLSSMYNSVISGRKSLILASGTAHQATYFEGRGVCMTSTTEVDHTCLIT